LSEENRRELNQLILLCSEGREHHLPADSEAWSDFISLAIHHGVAPLLWLNLKALDLPAEIHSRLRSVYAANLLRNRALRAEQVAVLAALARRGIRAHPLKGAFLGELLYHDLGARQSDDLDILIQPADLEKADCALQHINYRRTIDAPISQFRDSHELQYLNSAQAGMGLPLDLHMRLVPYGGRDPLVESVWMEGFTKEVLLVHLSVNQLGHRFALLKYVLDLKALIETSAGQIDWKRVITLARETPFTPGIYHSLRLVQGFVGERIPGSVLEALRPGWSDRKFGQLLLGDDLCETLARGDRLKGPMGALVILACTNPGGARIQHFQRLLFPPITYLQQQNAGRPKRGALQLYADRWRSKNLAGARELFRALLGPAKKSSREASHR
jgi:hypothetical protein